MAFDACMMRAVLSELSREYPEAKIEKILQPVSDEIVFVIHSGKRSGRLTFNVGPNCPRMQLTETVKENPSSAPMFCMYLRKRLSGARITEVSQPDFDRIARLKVSGYDEMGFRTELTVVCEIMGKYANFILLDKDDKILSALKIIDFSASTVRQVLPGLTYSQPAIPPKICPLDMTEEMLRNKLSQFDNERTVEKFITSTYAGVATQIAHELCYRAASDIDIPVASVNKEKLIAVLLDWQKLLREENYSFFMAIERSGKPKDYSYMPITYTADAYEYREYESAGKMLDCYFAERDRLEKIHQRAKDIKNLLSAAKSRTEKKLSIQREALLDSAKGEEYKRYGDLITASIYKLKRGDKELVTEDYYTEDMPTVRIPLDERLSPAANAQKMYKLYNKSKNAKAVLTQQVAIWERELTYLESVSVFLDKAESEQDIADIRDELYRSGYASRMKGYNPKKTAVSKPHVFKTEGGFILLVGKNNIQNDKITKEADKGDLWFHVKDAPGSHVILVTNGDEPADSDYTEAAEYAAAYSSLSESDKVAVDYTRICNIKKPSGSKPGFVTYKTNYTAYVTPKKKNL